MSEGFCHIRSLLQALQRSEGDETLKIFKTLTELLRKDNENKEYFYELNGVSLVLNVSVGTDVAVLNCVLDALAAATEDHDGNKAKLTIDRTFIIINKVLVSRESLGLTSSLRALVLLSYVCGENAEAQELANKTGCVNRMGEFFSRLSENISKPGEIKKDKIIFTWSILCTAIAAVCGEPPNHKNQETLQSVIRESVDFLSEWTEASKDIVQDLSCVKTLLIMLPYVLCDNKENQDCFARSGGIHTVINSLLELENKKNSGHEIDEIRVKLVYLLYISASENSLTSKLAGFLGIIPVLIRLLKQFHQKDKGTVVMCLSVLLNCPENEQIFCHMNIGAEFSTYVKFFAEGSECRKILEHICSLFKIKSGSKTPDEESLKNSNKICLDIPESPSSLTQDMPKSRRRYEDTGFRDYLLRPERNNEKFRGRSLYPKQVYHTRDESFFENKLRSRFDTIERSQNDFESEHEELDSKFDLLNRKVRKPFDERRSNFRDDRDCEDVRNLYSKTNGKLNFSRSSDFTYDKYGRQENFSPRHMMSGNLLKPRNSTSDLMIKARRLYPRNKMVELDELDLHQRRHYLSHSEYLDEEEPRRMHSRSGGRNSGEFGLSRDERRAHDNSRYSLDSQVSDDLKLDEDLRYEFRRASGERYLKDDLKRSDFRREYQRTMVERQGRDYYTDDNSRREHAKPVERRLRNNFNMDEERRREHLRALREQTMRNKYDSDDELRTTSARSSLESNWRDENMKDDYRRDYFKKLIDKQNTTNNADHEQNGRVFRDHLKSEGHKRSKSMGRVANFDIQSILGNLESSRDKSDAYRTQYKSHDSRQARSNSHNNSEKEIFEMPELISVRDNRGKEKDDVSLEDGSQSLKDADCKESNGNVDSEITSGFDETKCKEQITRIKSNESLHLPDEKDISSLNTSAVDISLDDSGFAFSEDEEKQLLAGLKKFGLNFKSIHQEFSFHEKRTPHDLYEKWKSCYSDF